MTVYNDNQRGSTLILVTWILMVLGIVAAFLLYRAEAEWIAVSNLEKSIQLRKLAEEVLMEQLQLLAADDTYNDKPGDPWFGETGRFETERDYCSIIVVVEDEGSKPNLNLLNSKGLRRLAGADEDTFIEPILDWRDPDNDEQTNGAELSYYLGLNPAYKPRNGFFSSVEELKTVKGGAGLYEQMASEVTVYGKFNPNTLSEDIFKNMLLSAGELEFTAEVLAERFGNFRRDNNVNRFYKPDDLLKVPGFTPDTREKLKPFFIYQGFINMNFISQTGLQVMLEQAGYKPELADEIIRRRQETPFENKEDVCNFLRRISKDDSLIPEDYFTAFTAIIRYRIWVTRGKTKGYLDAVYERERRDDQWIITPLAWRFLLNKDVPELSGEAVSESTEALPEESE